MLDVGLAHVHEAHSGGARIGEHLLEEARVRIPRRLRCRVELSDARWPHLRLAHVEIEVRERRRCDD